MEWLLRAAGAMCRSARVLALIAASLCLASAGCSSVGKDFARPDLDSFVLGQTTIADIVNKQGPPTSRVVRHSLNPASGGTQADGLPPAFRPASVAGTVETLAYRYSYASAPGILVGPVKASTKQLVLSFWNDRLVLYSFTSSFSAESVKFDENKAQSFVPGQTSRSDVMRILGRPNGEAVYPFVAREGTRMLFYDSISREVSGVTPGTTESVTITKIMRFLFDSSDRLIDSYRQTIFSGS
jgi:hypothetical protein